MNCLKGYTSVLESIVDKIKAAQTRVMVAVNFELIEVYKEIGRTIHDQQQESNKTMTRLPKGFKDDLPSPDQIARLLNHIK